jgi:hypothetical protein
MYMYVCVCVCVCLCVYVRMRESVGFCAYKCIRSPLPSQRRSQLFSFLPQQVMATERCLPSSFSFSFLFQFPALRVQHIYTHRQHRDVEDTVLFHSTHVEVPASAIDIVAFASTIGIHPLHTKVPL